MRVLLTNDDGITATGLNVMRRALLELPDVELGGDRAGLQPERHGPRASRCATRSGSRRWSSATARPASPPTARRWTACASRRSGLIEAPPELIVSGINHGANLGDDITYSGTVAAALEGIVLGVPAIAVSPAGRAAAGLRARWRAFVARVSVGGARRGADARGHAAQRERPGRRGQGRVRVPARQARLQRQDGADRGGRRPPALPHLRREPSYEHEAGTDFAAIAEGLIAVTPLHFDLTDQAGVEELAGFDLERLLRPAAEAVE